MFYYLRCACFLTCATKPGMLETAPINEPNILHTDLDLIVATMGLGKLCCACFYALHCVVGACSTDVHLGLHSLVVKGTTMLVLLGIYVMIGFCNLVQNTNAES